MISMISILLPRAAVSAARVNEVLDTDIVLKDIEPPKKFIESRKGYVEFKNVSFKYPDGDENVLENISFTARPGETTAFIGSTGSGKSTLVNLIPRFYDVTEGEILVNGVNIKEVSQHDLRDKIGYVPQKGVLFSGTIESNLKYGNIEASDRVVKKAAEIAQATEFINSKPENINMMLENTKEAGVTLYNNTAKCYNMKWGCGGRFNDVASCYSKFVYNSRSGFAMSSIDMISLDNMISLETWDAIMTSHRTGYTDEGIVDGFLV